MKGLLLFLILPVFSFSQYVPEPEIDYRPPNEVYVIVDEEPQFPGGNDSLRNYISSHTVYPSKAIENNVQGIVYVSFVVTAEGAIRNVSILRGVSPALDAEAKRVVMGMPTWIAGKEKGEKVAVNFTLPVHFRLSKVQETDDALNDEIIEMEEEEIEEARDPLEDHLYFGDDELEPEFPSNDNLISWEGTDPSFPGGHSAMAQFISENLDYSKIDLIAGIVYVQFMVDTLGLLYDIEIRRGLSEIADAAVVKMVSEMPQWIPGTFRDRPISLKMTLPVRIVTDE